MAEREPDPGFTVVDRRGRERSAPEPSQAEVGAEWAGSTTGAGAGGVSQSPPSISEVPEGPPGPRADLASLCAMLYSEALIQLGQVPDPMRGSPVLDLDRARFSIDLLGMLQEKTAGNRTPEESAVLEEALATLRIAYVSLTRAR